MPRSKDPFSNIKLSDDVGLDQRLFQQRDDGPTNQRDNAPTEKRANVRTDERGNAGTGQRDSARANHRTGEATVARSGAVRSRRVRARTKKPTTAVGVVIARQRVSGRHAYDIFLDQVSWMNRLKLEMEETYGKRISGNDIVKLALDLLIDDFKRHGENSKLFKALILGERTPTPSTAAPAETGGGGEDG